MSLVNLASQYYRTTISIFLFVIVSGSLVFNNIPKESSPDVSLPYIYVSLGLTGISPEDSEKLLIKPVEDEVSNICLLYTSPSPRDRRLSRMPSSA